MQILQEGKNIVYVLASLKDDFASFYSSTSFWLLISLIFLLFVRFTRILILWPFNLSWLIIGTSQVISQWLKRDKPFTICFLICLGCICFSLIVSSFKISLKWLHCLLLNELTNSWTVLLISLHSKDSSDTFWEDSLSFLACCLPYSVCRVDYFVMDLVWVSYILQAMGSQRI